jgi:signal transduction histidine kinase
MLSHELRNPLNASYLLAPGVLPNLPQEVGFACNIIQRQTLHVARLLDDLLDVARVTQGKIEIRRQVLDLTQLIERSDAKSKMRTFF